MWILPLVAGVIAFVFAWLLGVRYVTRRQPFQLLWTLALLQFGVASLAMVAGSFSGWSRAEFQVYWALGAVLNVPFLAAGEIALLFRRRWVVWACWIVLIFSIAYTIAVLRDAAVDAAALTETLPSGKEVFGAGTPAHRLPQYFSYPAYFILLFGTAWSAWKMRGRPELRDRFVGTSLIAVGATIVAGGATFAAYGVMAGFAATLAAGIGLMFWGFLRAGRQAASHAGSPGSEGVDPNGSTVTNNRS